VTEEDVRAWLQADIPERAFARAFGRFWEPRALPPEVRRRQRGACYRNALVLTTKRSSSRYVEGFAVSRTCPYIVIDHAWVVDLDGAVIDPTWADPKTREVGLLYFGVPLPLSVLVNLGGRNLYEPAVQTAIRGGGGKQ